MTFKGETYKTGSLKIDKLSEDCMTATEVRMITR